MRIAFFDIVSGISGDMTLGACVGAGVPFEQLVSELQKLPLEGYRIERREVTRSMISAVKIDVLLAEEVIDSDVDLDLDLKTDHDHEIDHDHDIEIGHDSVHSHGHDHSHGHNHSHGHHHHGKQRGYVEIVALINASSLTEEVKASAKAMFLSLAKAEATVHNTTVDEVHFHEVGAVDSIVDIVGTAICMDILGVERVYSTPVRTGSGGVIRTQHGMMPIPAPATVELLKEYPIELTDIPHELTTPTGATIIATLSAGVLDRTAALRVHSIGYGAGTKEFAGLPNMLRLVIADIDLDAQDEKLVLLETNIDDMNPELFPYVLELLLSAGARDVWLTPVLMKKGRPAHMLSVLAMPALRDALVEILMNETSTIGVRMQMVERRTLPRSTASVSTSLGDVMVKVIERKGVVHRVPEFEECRRIAQEQNLPLIEVYNRIEIELGSLASKSDNTDGNQTESASQE